MSCTLEAIGAVSLLWLGDDHVRVQSEQAAAPGSRLAGTVATGEALRIKVHRCLRRGDGFVIDGKLQSPTRALRRLLAEQAGA